MNATQAQLKRWSNNCAGLFLVSALMGLVAWLASRAGPTGGSSLMVWFLVVLGLASLAGWTWTAHKLAEKVADKVLFKPF